MGNITMVDGHVLTARIKAMTTNGSCSAMPAPRSTVCVPAAHSIRGSSTAEDVRAGLHQYAVVLPIGFFIMQLLRTEAMNISLEVIICILIAIWPLCLVSSASGSAITHFMHLQYPAARLFLGLLWLWSNQVGILPNWFCWPV